MSGVIPRPQAPNDAPDWGAPTDRTTVPASRNAPRMLRHWAVRALAADNRPYCADTGLADILALVISEMAANSVEHSASAHGGKVVAELYTLADTVGVRVVDQGPLPESPTGPVTPPPRLNENGPAAAERGRGLALIALNSRRYGWTAPPGHEAYSVWAELDAHRPRTGWASSSPHHRP